MRSRPSYPHARWGMILIALTIAGIGIAVVLISSLRGATPLPEPSGSAAGSAAGETNGAEAAAPRLGMETPFLLFDASGVDIEVSSNRSSVSWTLRDVHGATLQSGEVRTSRGNGIISLRSMKPGYYDVYLSVDDGALSKDASFAVLDRLSAVPNSLFAVSDHLRWTTEQAGVFSTLGVSAARFDVSWSTVEREKSVYTFDPDLDAKIQSLIERGIRPLVILNYRNSNYDENRTPSSPEGIAGFAAYAAAVAEHYGTDVDYEVYNEFDANFNNGGCGRTPDCYLQLLKPTYIAIKKAVPDARVVGPATAGVRIPWLSRLIDLGGLDYLDVFSVHSYDFREPPEAGAESRLKQLNALLRKHGDKPLWVTEYGWSASGSITAAVQARYLVRGSVLQRAAGVTRMFVYDLIDDGTKPENKEHNFGLVRDDGDGLSSLSPKQSYVAYSVMARMLGGVRYVGQASTAAASHAYEFQANDGSPTWVLWSTAGRSMRIETRSPIKLTSMYGETSTYDPRDGVVDLALTDQPVYVTGADVGRVSDVPIVK